MSADSRKVSTDALETLGTIISPEEKRDAIHLAVIPVKALHHLEPGEHVTAAGWGTWPYSHDAVGIVDPFLSNPVAAGEWFWLVIYPRKITSLRHVWSHPAFPEETLILSPVVPEALVLADERADQFKQEYQQEPETSVLDREHSEKWLRHFISTADCPDYETVLAVALDNKDSWDEQNFLHFIDRNAHGDIPPQFWDHLEVVTGVKIPPHRRSKHFSCSC